MKKEVTAMFCWHIYSPVETPSALVEPRCASSRWYARRICPRCVRRTPSSRSRTRGGKRSSPLFESEHSLV